VVLHPPRSPLFPYTTLFRSVPNEHRATVRLKELLQAGAPKMAKAKLPLYLGRDTEGRPLVYDLAEMPHLLIAGRTGTGKSARSRSEEHTSELQSQSNLVCRL